MPDACGRAGGAGFCAVRLVFSAISHDSSFKRAYFRKNGKVLKSTWFKLNGKMYFAGPDGALLTDGKYKIGDYYYGFDEQGVQLRGKTVIDGRFVRVNPISKELRERMHENGVPNDVLDRFSEVR